MRATTSCSGPPPIAPTPPESWRSSPACAPKPASARTGIFMSCSPHSLRHSDPRIYSLHLQMNSISLRDGKDNTRRGSVYVLTSHKPLFILVVNSVVCLRFLVFSR